MTAAERDERIRKHLEEEVWPTEDEMREFIRKVDENPVSYEELMADLEVIRVDTLREIAEEQKQLAPKQL